MIYGKYGKMIFENMDKNYSYRKNVLEELGELDDKIIKKEKAILEMKEVIEKQIAEKYPKPNSNEVNVISKYQQMIDALVEEKLMPYILEKV